MELVSFLICPKWGVSENGMAVEFLVKQRFDSLKVTDKLPPVALVTTWRRDKPEDDLAEYSVELEHQNSGLGLTLAQNASTSSRDLISERSPMSSMTE